MIILHNNKKLLFGEHIENLNKILGDSNNIVFIENIHIFIFYKLFYIALMYFYIIIQAKSEILFIYF